MTGSLRLLLENILEPIATVGAAFE